MAYSNDSKNGDLRAKNKQLTVVCTGLAMAALWKTCQCLRFGLAYKSIYTSQSAVNLITKRNFKAKWVAPTLRELKRRKCIENDKDGGEKIFHRSTFLEWYMFLTVI